MGEIANLLDEQFYTGLLRVEGPERPPPSPAPVDHLPLPEEGRLGRGDILLGSPTVSPSAPQPGQTVTVRLPLTNKGPVAAPVRVDASIVDAAGVPVVELAPDAFTPGKNAPLTRVYNAALPVDLQPGSYGVAVSVVDQLTTASLASQSFPNLFRIAALPAPKPPTPALLKPGNLDLLDPQVSPSAARPGQVVELRLPFLNTGPATPSLNLQAYLMGPDGKTTELSRQTFIPTLSAPATRTLRWSVPQGAAPGPYDLQVFVWDDKTFVPGDPSTYLIREQVNDLFRVETAPGLPTLKPGDLGSPNLLFSPSIVDVGTSTQGRLSIPNAAGSPFTGLVDVSLVDAGGKPVRSLAQRQGLDFQPRSAGSLALPLDTTEMAPGAYGAHVEVRDIAGSQVLLARDLSSVLQVRVPAGIRGINELTDVRWFYDAVMEPPDPRLISIGPPTPLPIRKTAGQPTGGLVTFVHRGEGGVFDVGYGIAAARLTGHDRPFRFFTRTQFRVPAHPVPTPVAVDIPLSGWPSTAIAPSGRYDAQKFIDRVDVSPRQTVYQNWDDDVFEVP